MGEGRVIRSLEDGVPGEQSAGRITNVLDEFEVVVRNCHAVLRGEAPAHEVRR